MMSSKIYKEILRIQEEGRDAVLITVIEKIGSGPATVGKKLLITSDGKKIGTVGGGSLEALAITRAKDFLKDRKSGILHFILDEELNAQEKKLSTGLICGGEAKLFFEFIGPSLRLYIFGAGHVGRAIAEHTKNLNYFVTVVDSRKEALDNIPADRVIHARYDRVFSTTPPPPGGYYVITTHSHVLDLQILRRVFDWQPAYVGILASRKKGSTLMSKLIMDIGDKIPHEIVYTPMGLDIGGDTPDEIAISVIAEIQALKNAKTPVKHKRQIFQPATLEKK